MIIKNGNKSRIFININIYLTLIFINLVFPLEFIDIKKLTTYDSYFVVLDTGLYLYNFNNSECGLIRQFNSSVYRSSNNKIILNELSDELNSYIFCLVNEYLFIFNEKNK